MDIPAVVALLTLLGSCCLGLVLLVVLVAVVALVLSGRLKSAKVSGLGAGVELVGTDKPPTPPPAGPGEPTAPLPSPSDSLAVNMPVSDRHDVHMDAGGDVAYGAGARIDKRQGGVDFGQGNVFTGATIRDVAGRDLVGQAVSLPHDPED